MVFGEFPVFETDTYTFLADYLPYAHGDGMEHRNSTIMTGTAAVGAAEQRRGIVATAAHEFFHVWNVERIRPASLEPFDFEDANPSAELWLAEGVTSYYENLIMHRVGFSSLAELAEAFGSVVNLVAAGPAARVRSPSEMSRLAPLVDAWRPVDRTNFETTFISYYSGGEALGLALDLALRGRTGPQGARATLDDFMRAMWVAHGRPGGRAPGLVAKPYALRDVRDRLAEVSDRTFADDFVDRYIEGREVPDYARLLAQAGLVLRKRDAGGAWLGEAQFDYSGAGARLTTLAAPDTPLYVAGLDVDDVLVSADGDSMTSPDRLERFLRRRKPGDHVKLAFLRRGEPGAATVPLAEDPRLELLPVESAGGRLGDAERRFRDEWLRSRQ
jgi:predicted metalloprotease with PDZ domain